MYKIMKSTENGLDELELSGLEKGCWIDVVAPSEEECRGFILPAWILAEIF